MKNNGFTLVELLGVIIVLAVILILVFPSVENIISQGEETTYQSQINTILDATYDWSLKNASNLPDKDNKIYVTLSELKNKGLVDDNIINPNTNEVFPDDLVISISNVGPNYKYTNKYSKQGGDYLYTAELELMASEEYNANKPSIVFSDMTPTEDGDYVTEVNIGDVFSDTSYTATSIDSTDITDKVIININYNNTTVSSVNTNKAGIYHINYTVVDSNGYSTTVVRNVIVLDNEAPVIVLPENNTIATSVTSYDLLNNIVCTDNSNTCNITTEGSIEFGVVGKYVIKYTAKDSSGNTSTIKRVITIQ